jgi:hypothetical protein
MSGRQERHIARLAHEFRSIIHHDFQGPCYVILEVGRLTTLCLCDRLNGRRPTPSRLQGGTPDGCSADRYQLHFALGENPYFIGLAEAFLFRFPWHILILPTAVDWVACSKLDCSYQFDGVELLKFPFRSK